MVAQREVCVQDLLASILSAQNREGGWSFGAGRAWTEATAIALLALAAADPASPGCKRGRDWLLRARCDDGGWPPALDVGRSSWVTALAICALHAVNAHAESDAALKWLVRQTGEESETIQRIRRKLLRQPWEAGEGTIGWPWFPDTSAWVVPTSFSILALEQAGGAVPAALDRAEKGRRFLLERQCTDGGWGYGLPRTLGYPNGSYPETTGAALLALHAAGSRTIGKAVDNARERLRTCRSAQGSGWLRLGLLAHGQKPPHPQFAKCRNVLDCAVTALAGFAEQGVPVFGIRYDTAA